MLQLRNSHRTTEPGVDLEGHHLPQPATLVFAEGSVHLAGDITLTARGFGSSNLNSTTDCA